MLTAHGVPQKGINEIVTYMENSHYQLACQKHFEITHAVSSLVIALWVPMVQHEESDCILLDPIFLVFSLCVNIEV